MHTMRTALSLLRLRLHWELAFRFDALVGALGGLLHVAGMLLFFQVIYGQVQSIAGWERPAALALVGTLSLLLELERGLLGGLRRLPRAVRQGTLEGYLVRPAPAPMLLALRGADLRVAWRLPVGLAVLAYALRLQPAPLERVPLYLASLLLALAVFGLLVFCMACLSFWLVEMNNLFPIVYDLTEFARYPETVYGGFMRLLFTTVLPLALLANWPVRLLMRSASPALLLHQEAVLAGFMALGWLLWRAGLRRYQGGPRLHTHSVYDGACPRTEPLGGSEHTRRPPPGPRPLRPASPIHLEGSASRLGAVRFPRGLQQEPALDRAAR
jgi:ABC-2 type transport system permease protein